MSTPTESALYPVASGPPLTPRMAATFLFNLGFNVYPLRRASRIADGQWTKHRDDRLKILQLQHRISDDPQSPTMPGVILDHTSGIVMVEEDGPNAARASAPFRLPLTLTVQSRRGKHFFFRWPATEPWPTSQGFYLVPRGDDAEIEFKANCITPMPPQLHHGDSSVVLSFAPGTPFRVADAPRELVDAVTQYEAERAALRAENAREARSAWANVLTQVMDRGLLDELVTWTGSWHPTNGTRPLRCPYPNEHAGRELERSSAYIVTRDAAGMRCDKATHELTVLQFLQAVGFEDSPKKVLKRLAAEGIVLPSEYDAGGKPELSAAEGDLEAATAKAVAALAASNTDDPSLFLRNNRIVRVERNEKSEAVIRSLSADGIRGELAARISWFREDNNAVPVADRPPRDIAINIAERDSRYLDFPPLRGLIDVPTFRPDGTLHAEPGYDHATGLYFLPARDYVAPIIPAEPTDAEVAAALAWFTHELFVDFPFVGNADKAHAIGLALAPFARGLIDGSTPLHLIDAPTPGSGKGKLVRTALSIGRKSDPPSTAWPTKEEEVEKRLLTFFAEGASALIFDNVSVFMQSDALSMALTEPMFKGRILGKSESPTFDVRTIFAMTSNNAKFDRDLVRRTIPCNIDPKMEKPEQRTGFKHPDLRAFVRSHNNELLTASLTLVRAWIVRGRPPGSATLGSYEAWAKTIGGILAVAGVPDFLGNLAEFAGRADPETDSWRAFCQAWYDEFHGEPKNTSEVLALAVRAGVYVGKSTSEVAQAMSLGRAIARYEGAIHGGFRIESLARTNNVKVYRMVRTSDAATPAPIVPTYTGDEF